MVIINQCLTHNSLFFSHSADFFEECIKEERYEAEKLDILRDAVRAKATYSLQSKQDSISSPTCTSPEPEPEPELAHENGNGVTKEKLPELKEEPVHENGDGVV